jgi:hypothetical protein
MKMSESFPRFLKWGKYTSKDSIKPDKISIKVTKIETFETQYGVNVNAFVDGIEMSIPLHNFNSLNTALLKLWHNEIKNKKIKTGTEFILSTHLGMSRNNRPIRKWSMEFNS